MNPSLTPQTIGILALQGDVVEHIEHYRRLGVECRPVRRAEEMQDLPGLIMPGGESTCLYRLMRFFGLDDAIRRRVEDGMKVWGTCAGAILAADDVVGEGGKLGLIRMTVKRNAFGSQLASFHSQAEIPRLGSGMIPLTFIRAPKIFEVGDDVDVLLHMQDFIAMVESDDVLATVFHPELTPCLAVHRYFAEKCGVPTREPSADDKWDMTSWTQLCRVG